MFAAVTQHCLELRPIRCSCGFRVNEGFLKWVVDHEYSGPLPSAAVLADCELDLLAHPWKREYSKERWLSRFSFPLGHSFFRSGLRSFYRNLFAPLGRKLSSPSASPAATERGKKL
jgi:hypothetical protein